MKTKTSFLSQLSSELHYGHLAIVGSCALLLVAVFIVRGDIKISAMFASAKSSEGEKILTFAEAKSKAKSELGLTDSNLSSTPEEKLSLLDPSRKAGQVLGEQIGLKIETSASLINDPRFDDIQILTTDNNSKAEITRYASDLLEVETGYNDMAVLGNLNSDDPVALEQSRTDSAAIASLLKEIYVPDSLAQFHKFKIIYYRSLEQVASNFLGLQSQVSLQQATSDMLSAVNGMNQTRLKVINEHGLSL